VRNAMDAAQQQLVPVSCGWFGFRRETAAAIPTGKVPISLMFDNPLDRIASFEPRTALDCV
jgi:hypothetical protein